MCEKLLKKSKKIDFGFKKIKINHKKELVNQVFNQVSPKYNLMNDLASLGMHRLWKNELINWLAPQPHQTLADLAGGTGDVAKKFVQNGGKNADIIDININMVKNGLSLKVGKIRHIIGNCEKLPIKDNSYHRATIAFGLRNITYREKALKEIYRILKPGGRFVCLEFSKIENDFLKKLYDLWSFNFLPSLGAIIANNRDAYQYLVESIRMFPNQDELALMMTKANFSRVKYKNLSEGIVALHSGWKI